MTRDLALSFRRLDRGAKLASGALLLAGLAVGIVVVATQTGSPTGLLDLRVYLGAARAFADGGSIYGFLEPTYRLGSTYPPFWSLVLVPVAALDIHLVEHAWTVLNLVLWFATLAALALPTRDRAGDEPPVSFLGLTVVWAVTLPSVAVWNTLNQGQVNILIWFLIALDLRSVVAARPSGGVLIGLATALKLIPGIFVVYFVLTRNLRPARNAVLSFLVLTGISALLAPADARQYWTSIVFESNRIGAIGDPLNNSLRSLLARLGVSGALEIGLWVLLSALVIAATVRPVRDGLARGSIISVAFLVGTAAALISPISWVHHLVFGCFPLLLLVGPARAASRAISAACLVALAIAYVDPIGFGRSTPTAIVRTLVLVGAIVFGPWLVEAELRWRRAGASGSTPASGDIVPGLRS